MSLRNFAEPLTLVRSPTLTNKLLASDGQGVPKPRSGRPTRSRNDAQGPHRRALSTMARMSRGVPRQPPAHSEIRLHQSPPKISAVCLRRSSNSPKALAPAWSYAHTRYPKFARHALSTYCAQLACRPATNSRPTPVAFMADLIPKRLLCLALHRAPAIICNVPETIIGKLRCPHFILTLAPRHTTRPGIQSVKMVSIRIMSTPPAIERERVTSEYAATPVHRS